MCLSQPLTKAKAFYKNDKTSFILIAAIFIAGLALRLFFINATDISGDEVFFTTYAFKIASLLWQAPLIAAGLAAISAIFLYLVIKKRNLWAALLFALALLAARYVIGVPDLIPRVGPVYILATTAMIYFTNLTPNIAGELVSSISMILLAFTGLFFGNKWGKCIGILDFALIMISPFLTLY